MKKKKKEKKLQKGISYRLKFFDGIRFMSSLLSNFVDNLAQEIHKIKRKHRYYNKRMQSLLNYMQKSLHKKPYFLFPNVLKTCFFSKIIALEYDLSYFLYICICINCYKYDITLLQKKKKEKTKSKMIFSQKNILKGDWHSRSHSRKSSSNSLYFYEDLHGRFHTLLSSEKTQET